MDTALTAHDRCDRCGAQAAARTRHVDGRPDLDLFWCGHHFRAHEVKLTESLVAYQAVTDDDFKEFARA